MNEEAGMLFDLIDTAEFMQRLQQQLRQLPGSSGLDLQQALQKGSFALPETLQISILNIERRGITARIRVSLFFKSVIAGCNCADDPTPADTLDEYASATIILDQNRGFTDIRID